MMYQFLKRTTALMLALAMCTSLLCSGAWAAESSDAEPPVEAVTEIVETDTDAPEASISEAASSEEIPTESETLPEAEESVPSEPEVFEMEETEEEPATLTPEEALLPKSDHQRYAIPTRVNPVYQDVLSPEALGDLSVVDEGLLNEVSSTVYTSVKSASSFLRKQQVKRETEITFTLKTSREDYGVLLDEIVDLSFAHTGVPNEGDYLMLHWAGYGGSIDIDGDLCTFGLNFRYYSNAEQEAAVGQRIDEIIETLELRDKQPYDQISAIYDYLCTNISYDYDYYSKYMNDDRTPWSAYGGLINGSCVCQGYAESFYRLALTLGIDSRCILSDEINHSWNIVKLGSFYYNLDATWDSNYYESFGRLNHQFFLKCPKNFTDHPRDLRYSDAAFHTAHPMAARDYPTDGNAAKVSLTKCSISLSKTEYTYDGKAKKPSVTVKDGSLKLVKDVDYKVTYKSNTNAGTASVVISGTGIGAYSGSVTKTFTILKGSNAITQANVTKTYSAKAQSFTVTPVLKDTAAKLSYKSSNSKIKVTAAGKVTIPAKFMGKCTITITAAESPNSKKATKSFTLTVNPTKTTFKSVTNASGCKMVVQLNKNTVGSGYQVQYCTKKDFSSGAKYENIGAYTNVYRTIKGMTKGKTYYVRVRTVKVINKVNFYSGWSAVKSVKIVK